MTFLRCSVLYRMHVLELFTGQKHPDTTSTGVVDHSAGDNHFSFAIQISGQYVGVMFISHDVHDNQLLVWNWRTGATELVSITHRLRALPLIGNLQSLRGSEIGSFGFVTDRHILLAVVDNPLIDPEEDGLIERSLIVVDFKTAPKESTSLGDLNFECALDLPRMLPTASVVAISARSDPAPNWTPSPDLKVPFHTARRDRLFVITIWVAGGGNVSALLLLVPSSTIVAKLDSVSPDERGRRFDWEEWGPSGTHLRLAPREHTMIWVCFVFGSSFIAPYRPHNPSPLLPPPGPKMIQIFDFNQLAIKRLLDEGVEDESEVSHVITKPSTVILNRIFPNPVVTSLPYRWRTKKAPHHPGYTFESAMLSEDAIVTVTSVS